MKHYCFTLKYTSGRVVQHLVSKEQLSEEIAHCRNAIKSGLLNNYKYDEIIKYSHIKVVSI